MVIDEKGVSVLEHYLDGSLGLAYSNVDEMEFKLESKDGYEDELIEDIAERRAFFLRYATKMLRVPSDPVFGEGFRLTDQDRRFVQRMLLEGYLADWCNPDETKRLVKKISDYTGYEGING